MNRQNQSPLVTVAIPNYNTAAYIGEAIESAVSQTFHDIEILIIDNASTDNSRDIIEDWSTRDNRIIVRNFDVYVNATHNWNRCLEYAKGQYIVFLHADDRLKPNFLSASLEIFSCRPDLGYVFAEKEIIDGEGKVISQDQFYEASAIIPGLSEARVNFLGWHTAPVQMLIRTECMRAIGGYEYNDVWPVLLLNLGWDVGYLHTPLVQYRQHNQSCTAQFIKDKTMFMTIYLIKMVIMNYHLPPEAAHLINLKEKVMERAAYTCLAVYCLDVLGRNEKRLCEEYLALARSFWLDIDQTPLYQFLNEALMQNNWTVKSLKKAWNIAKPESISLGPPYPLPDGSTPFQSDESYFHKTSLTKKTSGSGDRP